MLDGVGIVELVSRMQDDEFLQKKEKEKKKSAWA
jgi:hypothetical protein